MNRELTLRRLHWAEENLDSWNRLRHIFNLVLALMGMTGGMIIMAPILQPPAPFTIQIITWFALAVVWAVGCLDGDVAGVMTAFVTLVGWWPVWILVFAFTIQIITWFALVGVWAVGWILTIKRLLAWAYERYEYPVGDA